MIDLEQLAEEASKKSNQKLFAQFKSKLVGHKERITSLSWSQFDPQLLVSCSYDLTVQVKCFYKYLFLEIDFYFSCYTGLECLFGIADRQLSRSLRETLVLRVFKHRF